ncbi:MAG: hypothetical protein WD512_05745, partial [Candidatus Paceibacterota bacterium]
MTTDNISHQYKNIINICNYKIYICNRINWYLKTTISDIANLDEVHRCHKLSFKNNVLCYPSASIAQIDISKQHFTIQHFIYYLISESVKVYKRNSKRYTDHDIIDLIEMNIA